MKKITIIPLLIGLTLVACTAVPAPSIPTASPQPTAVLPLLTATIIPTTAPSDDEIAHRISAVTPVTIYSGPGSDYPKVGILDAGANARVMETREGDYAAEHWMNIVCPDNNAESCWVLWDMNAFYNYEGPPVALEIPDPASLKLEPSNTAISPDGVWEVQVTQSDIMTFGVEDARFFYVELTLNSLKKSVKWTPVSEWHVAGLGQEYAPQPFHWSLDGHFLYYTSPFDHHGACVVYDNIGNNLDRLDLTDGSVAVLQPPLPLGILAISPDETRMAYNIYVDGYQLIVRDMATAYDEGSRQESVIWQIPLDINESGNISQIAWSPDNRHVMVKVTEMADNCQPANVTEWDLDVETGEFVQASNTVFPTSTP